MIRELEHLNQRNIERLEKTAQSDNFERASGTRQYKALNGARMWIITLGEGSGRCSTCSECLVCVVGLFT